MRMFGISFNIIYFFKSSWRIPHRWDDIIYEYAYILNNYLFEYDVNQKKIQHKNPSGIYFNKLFVSFSYYSRDVLYIYIVFFMTYYFISNHNHCFVINYMSYLHKKNIFVKSQRLFFIVNYKFNSIIYYWLTSFLFYFNLPLNGFGFWKPLFSKLSYFGLYRSIRNKWKK